MANIDRLSTASVPASQRLAFWKGIFADSAQPLVIEARPDAFHGAVTRLTAGDIEITSVTSTPLISRSAGDGTRRFSLQLVHSGQCRLRHAGSDIVAQAGDMILIDGSKPYELAFARPVQGLVLSLPWARLGDNTKELEALAGRSMTPNGGPAVVLSSFIRSAWDQLVERDGEEWPQSASAVIWDLLASVLQGERSTEPMRNHADNLRRRATALINDRLCDPEFRSSAISKELGVSTRYLQLVFAEAGTTPAHFLLARRLDAAAKRLRHMEGATSITDIALECGFNDLSYFSRAFRRRFGVSARYYRSGQYD